MAADEERRWRMHVDAEREGDGAEIWSLRSYECLKRNGGHGVEKMVATMDRNEMQREKGLEGKGWKMVSLAHI